MKSYPIWNKVTSCIYSSDKSYGVRSTGTVQVFVGTSAKNSHAFVKHDVTRRETADGVEFRFYVDGVCVKRALLVGHELKPLPVEASAPAVQPSREEVA
jgi:hypothetical protein